MSNSFNLMDENPNLGNGSNGCLCSELGNADTKGPFIVFAATETDNIFAPFPVLCAPCAARAFDLSHADSAPKPKKFESVAEKRRVENRRARSIPQPLTDEDGPSI